MKMTAPEYSFGSWVKRRRKALDLTQDELARRVGCSLSLIFKIESDERRPSRQIAKLLAEQLEITDQLDKKPAALSVGQRQRVSCARALAHGPQLLLADEPTAALDPLNAERVMQALLAQARHNGACCVIATHDEPLARASGLQVRRISCRRDADGGVTATLGEAC